MTVEELYGEFVRSEGISTDTRQDVKGTLFFALKGDRFDGNRYVPDAVKAGCRLAVTEMKEYEGEPGVCYTPSALKLLQELAAHHRRVAEPRVLAITGSNGKTTTKELVSEVLSKQFNVLATIGNLNNHIGVPLTLLSIDGEEVAVIEMGANHPGEIQALARIAAPDVGLITNVGKAHLEGFGSLKGVLDAKGELYEFLSASGGEAIVDGEDEMLLEKASTTGVKALPVGAGQAIPVSVTLLKQSPFLEVELKTGEESHYVNTQLVGTYNLQNIRLAAACGIHFGVPGNKIADAIGSYTPENQRSQMVEGEYNRVILDSYNANPTSMREAVGGLTSYAGMPPMVILGDMAELGASSLDEHRELVRWIGTLRLDRIVLVGPQFSQVCEPSVGLLVFNGIDDLQSHLEQNPPKGYTILVKGSRVMGLERIAPLLVNNK
ncbi:MAG: UDP-N-acetylmuramoyl-tripeptide--D-alanyl-D-alanine ligase [Bacteroidetes bacterium]|nr:UDP-N-acetylmuramoyl-tripeptide--D-alanyl-D-alanine ligase [Bacteroidota bacterium]